MDRLSNFQKALIIEATPYNYKKELNYGDIGTIPVDQSSIQEFNIDPLTGCPMYDITAILKASKLDQRNLLSQLDEFKADYLPEDISDEDALKYMKPFLAQMPSELAEYAERVTRSRIEDEIRAKGIKDEAEINSLLEARLAEIKKSKDIETKSE